MICQAVSVSLPQTAYLKLIDIWLFFGLILPFVGFCLSVAQDAVDGGQPQLHGLVCD